MTIRHQRLSPTGIPFLRQCCRCAVLAAGLMGCRESRSTVEQRDELWTPTVTVARHDVQQAADDWCGWRGLDRQGRVDGVQVPATWSPSRSMVWKTPVAGRGHASPCIIGDRVMLATADESSQRQRVLCYSRDTGQLLWEREVHHGGFPDSKHIHARNTQASSTTACDGQLVFATFLNQSKIRLSAMNLNGEPAWRSEVGAFSSEWGYASSPAMSGDSVLVLADSGKAGFIAAVDRADGRTLWSTVRPTGSSYSSPVVAEVGGRRQVIAAGCNTVAGYDAATGKEIWRCQGPSDTVSNTPVVAGDLVFASGGYPQTAVLCVAATGSGDVTGSLIKWKHNLKIYVPSMVCAEDHLYAITDQGIAYCWSGDTGKQKWKGRLEGDFSASLILIGDKLLAFSEQGDLFVVAADPARFSLIGKERIADEIFATPAVSGSRLLVRLAHHSGGVRREELWCMNLNGAEPPRVESD